MKRVELTQDQYALVDDEDYDVLNKYTWYAAWNKHTSSFYAGRNSKYGELYKTTLPVPVVTTSSTAPAPVEVRPKIFPEFTS